MKNKSIIGFKWGEYKNKPERKRKKLKETILARIKDKQTNKQREKEREKRKMFNLENITFRLAH